MRDDLLSALYELVSAAEDTLPVFDGMSGYCWSAMNGVNRRERLKRAIEQTRKSLHEGGMKRPEPKQMPLVERVPLGKGVMY